MTDRPTLAALASAYGETEAHARLGAPALPAIRAALSAAPAAIIDRPVAVHRDIYAATVGLALPASRTAYLDVPLTSIVGLIHKHFAPNATTWRSLLKGIHGVGWGWDMLDYLDSEYGDRPPPLDDAAGSLQLQAFGGALICTNGMHRLVAAVCWLAARYGDAAMLRKVPVRYQPANRAAVALMNAVLGAGARLDAARINSRRTVILRAQLSGRTRYWVAHGRHVTSIGAPGGWLGSLRRRFRGLQPDEGGLDWRPVSRELAAALADTGWLRAQHHAPRYTDRPA